MKWNDAASAWNRSRMTLWRNRWHRTVVKWRVVAVKRRLENEKNHYLKTLPKPKLSVRIHSLRFIVYLRFSDLYLLNFRCCRASCCQSCRKCSVVERSVGEEVRDICGRNQEEAEVCILQLDAGKFRLHRKIKRPALATSRRIDLSLWFKRSRTHEDRWWAICHKKN